MTNKLQFVQQVVVDNTVGKSHHKLYMTTLYVYEIVLIFFLLGFVTTI